MLRWFAGADGIPYSGKKPSILSITEGGLQKALKCNLDAIAAPTQNDDESDGYGIGSLWFFGQSIYVCNNPTDGSATWVKITFNYSLEENLNCDGHTVYFGVKIYTPNIGNSNTVTIDLTNGNHCIIDCSDSTDAITCNITVPPGACSGTIVILNDDPARDITFVPSVHPLLWLGVEPDWIGDPGLYRAVAFVYTPGYALFLSATPTNSN
jgi:hypothetical protein